MQDGFLAFAQIAGVLGETNANWPGLVIVSQPLSLAGAFRARPSYQVESRGLVLGTLSWILLICGILCEPPSRAPAPSHHTVRMAPWGLNPTTVAAAETHAAVAKVCPMVCLLCRDFDVDAAGPQCMFYWTWHHDLILQFSLPVMVRIVGIKPYKIETASDVDEPS